MAVANPYQQYQNQSVMTANPGQLTLMLYNGCIKFIKQAVMAIEKKDIPKANNSIIRAQNIVLEFMSTLNMQYELSENLMALYDFMYQQLIKANLHKDAAILEEVLDIAVGLRDAWAEMLTITKSKSTGSGE